MEESAHAQACQLVPQDLDRGRARLAAGPRADRLRAGVRQRTPDSARKADRPAPALHGRDVRLRGDRHLEDHDLRRPGAGGAARARQRQSAGRADRAVEQPLRPRGHLRRGLYPRRERQAASDRHRQGSGGAAGRADDGLDRPAVGARPHGHELRRGGALMPEFALIAEDGCVANDVLAFIAAAVNLQMQRDVAPLWGDDVWTVVALDSMAGIKNNDTRKVLTFKRKLHVAGALGLHTETSGGIDYAEALPPAARPPGEAIDGTTTSHEVIETFGDPTCNAY